MATRPSLLLLSVGALLLIPAAAGAQLGAGFSMPSNGAQLSVV